MSSDPSAVQNRKKSRVPTNSRNRNHPNNMTPVPARVLRRILTALGIENTPSRQPATLAPSAETSYKRAGH